jgi:hypothetical protein
VRLALRLRHQPPIIRLRHLGRAHAAQMLGHELAIEQREPRPVHHRH